MLTRMLSSLPRSKELEIPIVDVNGTLIFKSMRANRWASESVLLNASDAVVAKTSDRLSNMPMRTITIEMGSLGEEVEMKRRGLMTRACVFATKDWEWEWRYGRKDEGAELNGHTLLVLERTPSTASGEAKEKKVRVAQLVRDSQTRTEGTKASSAGHGGKLDIALGAGEEEEKLEALVVMTCLVMLKKEMDRRETVHPIPISLMISGGSS
jgi:hypothetical protein